MAYRVLHTVTHAPAIHALAGPDWWQDVTLPMLEQARIRVRSLEAAAGGVGGLLVHLVRAAGARPGGVRGDGARRPVLHSRRGQRGSHVIGQTLPLERADAAHAAIEARAVLGKTLLVI